MKLHVLQVVVFQVQMGFLPAAEGHLLPGTFICSSFVRVYHCLRPEVNGAAVGVQVGAAEHMVQCKGSDLIF